MSYIPPYLESEQTLLHESIADQLNTSGFSINACAIPLELARALMEAAKAEPLKPAGIGRGTDQTVDHRVRKDHISWITSESIIGKEWLEWVEALKISLNRQLLLGLFSFESHFAHYPPGAFYKKHVDAFQGQSNRILSMVVYLNPDWQSENAGELVIYLPNGETMKVTPTFGTLVTFLSEEFPHEVLPAKQDRYSIACWFRLNTSSAQRVDPPR